MNFDLKSKIQNPKSKIPPIHHLYLHIPFCARVCPYCAFYVHGGGVEAQRNFTRALIAELRQVREKYPLDLHTIYFGGGTPSLLSAELFAEIAEALPPCAREITLEVNPATVTDDKARAWRVAGVNRVSLGVQSFDPEYLRLLGRQHTPAEATATVQQLRSFGFSNLNIDLMFALPQQPPAVWTQTLQSALDCQPDHLSCYALTYEEDTPFFRQLNLGHWKKDEPAEIAMFEETVERLTTAGLPPYEISNFARPGFESAHNRAYWLGADYLGVGPSAYSTVGLRRWRNLPDTTRYVSAGLAGEDFPQEVEELTPEIRRREQIMFGLRMREGVEQSWLEAWPSEVAELGQEGLLEIRGERWVLTPRGRLVADTIAAMFA